MIPQNATADAHTFKRFWDGYSGDTMTKNMARDIVPFMGKLWFCFSMFGHEGSETARIQQAIPREFWQGEVFTYAKKCGRIETDEDRYRFYEGMAIQWNGQKLVAGPEQMEVTEIKTPAESQLCLF